MAAIINPVISFIEDETDDDSAHNHDVRYENKLGQVSEKKTIIQPVTINWAVEGEIRTANRHSRAYS